MINNYFNKISQNPSNPNLGQLGAVVLGPPIIEMDSKSFNCKESIIDINAPNGSSSLLMCLEKQHRVTQILGLLHPCERPGRSPWLLISVWPSRSHCSHLRSEQTRRKINLSHSLYLVLPFKFIKGSLRK